MLTTLLYSLFALDQTLSNMAGQYGAWIYALLFVVIFAETGLVVFPFLPGDSILFISGTVVATAGLDVHLLVGLLIAAAVLGDSLNYAIGHYIGPRVYDRPDSRWFKQAHLRKTQAFYDKYGGVTIIIGRFIPIIRTFAPFLAGVAGMSLSPVSLVQRHRGRAVDQPAGLRRLPVRQYPLGQAEPVADRHRDRDRLADPRGQHVPAGATPARLMPDQTRLAKSAALPI